MLTWARLLSVPRRRVNPSRTGDPHPWNTPFLINRREERCEDSLAHLLRRLSLDLVGIARDARDNMTPAVEKFCEILRRTSSQVGERTHELVSDNKAWLA